MDSYHLPVLKQLAEEKKIKLKSIWNRTLGKSHNLAEKYGIVQVCESFEGLIQDGSIDCITIVLEKTICSSYIKKTANAMIPFLAEKPPAETFAAARNLSHVIGGIPHIIGFNRRFVPMVEMAKQNIPDRIDGYHFDMWRKNRRDSRFIFETGIHAINLAEYFFGKIIQVQVLRKWFTDKDTPSLLLKINHRNCVGFIDFQSQAGYVREELRVFSNEGIMELSLCLPYVDEQPGRLRSFGKDGWKSLTPPLEDCNKYENYGFSGEYRELINSLKSHAETRSTIYTTLSCLEIAEWSETASAGDILHL